MFACRTIAVVWPTRLMPMRATLDESAVTTLFPS